MKLALLVLDFEDLKGLIVSRVVSFRGALIGVYYLDLVIQGKNVAYSKNLVEKIKVC